jgi:hypothetical protein
MQWVVPFCTLAQWAVVVRDAEGSCPRPGRHSSSANQPRMQWCGLWRPRRHLVGQSPVRCVSVGPSTSTPLAGLQRHDRVDDENSHDSRWVLKEPPLFPRAAKEAIQRSFEGFCVLVSVHLLDHASLSVCEDGALLAQDSAFASECRRKKGLPLKVRISEVQEGTRFRSGTKKGLILGVHIRSQLIAVLLQDFRTYTHTHTHTCTRTHTHTHIYTYIYLHDPPPPERRRM